MIKRVTILITATVASVAILAAVPASAQISARSHMGKTPHT